MAVSGLREYQQQAITALADGWSAGLLRIGVALPTGTGKTHVMAELAVSYAAAPGLPRPGKVLVLVHRDTLVEQTERRMREHGQGRGVTVGVVKADRNVVGAHIVVASVHTLRSAKRLEQLHTPTLVIVDEAHVSMSDTYAQVFGAFAEARVAGFTATWTRSDSRRLGDFWQKIVYQRGIRWAIREGFLVPPKALSIGAPEGMTDGVRTRGGDYVDADLGRAVALPEVRDNVVRGYREHAAGAAGVLFAPTRESADYFGQALRDAGIPAAGIYAGTGARDRRVIFDAYRRGTVKVLTTCSALAEGWDAPWCRVAMLCRPTRHAGRYVQQVGRVLRPWPGKTDALVLDFAGGSQGMSLSLEAVLAETTPLSTDVDVDPDGLDPDEIAEETEAEAAEDAELTFTVGSGTKPVDLFAGTGARWLVTDGGVPFVATTTTLYFLAQVEDAWSVGMCSVDSLQGGRWLRQGLSADDALNYASIVAVDDDASIAGYDAPWRRAKKPTEGQIKYAMSQGIYIGEDETKSSLSDKFTTRRASATLAPIAVR